MLVIFWVFFASGLILKGNFLKDYAIILGNLAYYDEYKRPCFFTLSGTSFHLKPEFAKDFIS